MREMNCKRATELLPLYTAGDLEDSREREVAAHLAACDGCRALAGEFASSRELLAEAFETPEFGADFYAGIRSAVLAEIKRDGRTPSTPSLFATLFGRRLIYAASLALLLLACGLALQHFRHAANESQQEMAGDRHETREQQQPQQANVPSPSPQIKKQENVPQTVLAKESPRKRQRLSVEPAAEKQRVVPRQTDSARIENTQIATVPGATATVGSTNAASQSAPEVSRIEIQTADPNIRIIWLTPQKSEAPNPEKDNHENGDRK